jgi:hypothetical protein
VLGAVVLTVLVVPGRLLAAERGIEHAGSTLLVTMA